MLIAHHPHLVRAAAIEPLRPPQVRIDGRSYAATAHGSIAAGALKGLGVLDRRSAGGRTS